MIRQHETFRLTTFTVLLVEAGLFFIGICDILGMSTIRYRLSSWNLGRRKMRPNAIARTAACDALQALDQICQFDYY